MSEEIVVSKIKIKVDGREWWEGRKSIESKMSWQPVKDRHQENPTKEKSACLPDPIIPNYTHFGNVGSYQSNPMKTNLGYGFNSSSMGVVSYGKAPKINYGI